MVGSDPQGSFVILQGVFNILTIQRNRIDLESNGDLRLNLTKLDPNISFLVNIHQVHPSH